MKKLMTVLLLAATIVSLSGCFPVFVPVHEHHHGYYGGYYRR